MKVDLDMGRQNERPLDAVAGGRQGGFRLGVTRAERVCGNLSLSGACCHLWILLWQHARELIFARLGHQNGLPKIRARMGY